MSQCVEITRSYETQVF